MIREWLQKHYTSKEISQILITYNIVNIGTFAVIWAGCYIYRPGLIIKKSPYFQHSINNIIMKYPNISKRLCNNIKMTEKWVGDNQYFKKMSKSIGINSERLTKSFIESIIIEKICFPVIVPLQIWVSIK